MVDRSGKRGARLDAEVVRRGLCATRAKAAGLILAGRIFVDRVPVTKCGAAVRPDQAISLSGEERPYASRGGEKLAGALRDLDVSVEGLAALDVGASTGGFTDCLLRHGARKVYAVDVGERLLDDRLRKDPRVVCLERVNFRHAGRDLLPERVPLATVDVSFISLRHILPPLRELLSDGATVLALVKPQFEAGRRSVGKGGVVRDDDVRRATVRDVAGFAGEIGYRVVGEAESRVRGPKGNREVFLRLTWQRGDSP